LLAIVIIDFKRYPSTYCLMQGRSFFKLFTSKLESQPLRKHMDITQRWKVFISCNVKYF